jgi:hypothetical protein
MYSAAPVSCSYLKATLLECCGGTSLFCANHPKCSHTMATQTNQDQVTIDQPMHLPVREPNRADSINRAARSSGAGPDGKETRRGGSQHGEHAGPSSACSPQPDSTRSCRLPKVSGNPIATNLPFPSPPQQFQRDINPVCRF